MFYYNNDILSADGISLKDIATHFGTPTYVYSEKSISDNSSYFKKINNINLTVCYAVKANSNLSILNLMNRYGFGFDVVSIGELLRVKKINADISKCIFSGVGKKDDEIETALKLGIHSLNVENMGEFERINKIAKSLNLIANIMIRINPNISVDTHPFITTALDNSKFGISHSLIREAIKLCKRLKNTNLIGISFHLGSQIKEIGPYIEGLQILLDIRKMFKEDYDIIINKLDIGGGLGVAYSKNDTIFPIDDFIKRVNEVFSKASTDDKTISDIELILEPGRSMVANSAVLLSKVIAKKKAGDKNFLIVDAAMNDLIRPILYNAQHQVKTVNLISNDNTKTYDIVGPICESSDVLGKNIDLQVGINEYIAIYDTGAYCSSMSSNYNSRTLPAEVMIKDGNIHLIREREKHEDLWRNERII